MYHSVSMLVAYLNWSNELSDSYVTVFFVSGITLVRIDQRLKTWQQWTCDDEIGFCFHIFLSVNVKKYSHRGRQNDLRNSGRHFYESESNQLFNKKRLVYKMKRLSFFVSEKLDFI